MICTKLAPKDVKSLETISDDEKEEFQAFDTIGGESYFHKPES